MSRNPKNRDENAKNKDWQTPMNLPGASPEEYPERKIQRPIKNDVPLKR